VLCGPSDPQFVSQAIDPSAGDGEVNSHQAWPSEDGNVVVETDEDFDPFSLTFEITGGPNAGGYPVAEGGFTTPLTSLPDSTMSGPTVYVGLGCDGTPVPPAPSPDHVAVVQRGACTFDQKAQNAIDDGYAGMVVFNDRSRGDSIVVMAGESRDVPGVFVGHSTGLAVMNVGSAADLVVGAEGAPVEAVSNFGRWGNVRIWDYTDEANPVLASEFDTVCSATPGDESCIEGDTYSVHNVVVEDDLAYVSWYTNGMLVVDVSDPYDPVEVARYNPGDEAFEEQNGGIQDMWGVLKEPDSPWVYGSDRNGGLYVLELLGSGSSKRNRSGSGKRNR
jgi:hypothetical protein